MTRIALAFLIVAFSWTATAGAREADAQAGSFEAEAAVRNFAAQVADGDFAGALESFRFRLQAERLNHVAWVEAMASVHPQGLLPVSRYPGYAAINATFLSEHGIACLRNMIYSLLLPKKYLESLRHGRYNFPDAQTTEDVEREAADIMDILSPKRLRDLKVLRLDRIEPPSPPPDGLDRTYARTRDRRGYDECAEFLILYEFDGGCYRGTATTYRYGDEWCVGSLGSLMASWLDDSGIGILVPVSAREYETFLDEVRTRAGRSKE